MPECGPARSEPGSSASTRPHSVHFTRILNDPEDEGHVPGCRVVAAYPQGSRDIESSVRRVPDYTRRVREMGVEIVPSIEALLQKVDVVLLETNDGRPHLEQAAPVLKAGQAGLYRQAGGRNPGGRGGDLRAFQALRDSRLLLFRPALRRRGSGSGQGEGGEDPGVRCLQSGCDGAESSRSLLVRHPWCGIPLHRHGVPAVWS